MKKIFLSILVLTSIFSYSQQKDHKGKYRFDSLYASLSQQGIDTTAFKLVAQRVSDGKFFKMYWPTFGSSGSSTFATTLNVQYTDAANSGTSETDLMSYTLPANTLANDGDRLEIEGWFTYAANANTKTFKFHFGGFNTTITSGFVSASGGEVRFTATIIRTGAATQRITYNFEPTNGTTTRQRSSGTVTLSGTAVIKFTGQSNTASDDITQKTMSVTYYPYTP